MSELIKEFGAHGRGMYGDINLESRLQNAAREVLGMESGKAVQQARVYSTSAKSASFNSLRDHRHSQKRSFRSSSRSYATTTNPNPPYGIKNASNSTPARVALIGKFHIVSQYPGHH